MGASASGSKHIVDPGKQARSASGIPIVPSFDGYRAFAILGVVMLHLTMVSGIAAVGTRDISARLIWGTFGHAVELLFIVSGFVVFLPTVARGGDFGGLLPFAVRRGARLLPAYWLILLLTLLLIAVADPTAADFSGWGDAFFNFTATTVPAGLFIPDIPLGFGFNPPLWTLSVEVGFYIVLPFVAVAFYRRPWAGLAIAALITIAWTIAFDHVNWVTTHLGMNPDFGELVRIKLSSGLQLPTWAYSFALGMAGAWTFVRSPEIHGGRLVLPWRHGQSGEPSRSYSDRCSHSFS